MESIILAVFVALAITVYAAFFLSPANEVGNFWRFMWLFGLAVAWLIIGVLIGQRL